MCQSLPERKHWKTMVTVLRVSGERSVCFVFKELLIVRNSHQEKGEQSCCLFSIGGKLVSISTGAPFEFRVYPNHEDNQRRYHEIGKSVEHHVYGLLIEKCGLHRCNIPVGVALCVENIIFRSLEGRCAPRWTHWLLLRQRGYSNRRVFNDPHPWIRSRASWTMVTKVGAFDACSSFLLPSVARLIMNNGLSMGAQIDYIRRARTLGYAVIVTNTNLNISESLRASSSSGARIRVSMSRSTEIDRHTRLANGESCSLTKH